MNDLSDMVKEEAFWLICGERLGWGMSRTTYVCDLLPDCVVKVENDSGHFQNVMEWKVWKNCFGSPYEKWLSPCRFLSPNGRILIQERTTPPRECEYPDRMPAFLADFKKRNYGMLKGTLVCHDYGTSMIMDTGFTKRMKKVEWWSE